MCPTILKGYSPLQEKLRAIETAKREVVQKLSASEEEAGPELSRLLDDLDALLYSESLPSSTHRK